LKKIDARAVYASQLAMIPDSNLIFLDETGFNQHTCRTYGYSTINAKAFINVPANRNINKSLLCAIGVNGVIAYSYRQGAYNSESFKFFILQHLVPHFRSNPAYVLIMDNAQFHKSSAILDLLRLNNIVFKFLVPYSLELNPIEEFFSAIKSRFNALRVAEPLLTIDRCIDR
jgi:transposase